MTIGSGIALMIIGAILAFAVGDTMVAGVNLRMVGYILMLGGGIGLILGLFLSSRRSTRVVTRENYGGADTVVREERRDPPIGY